MSFNHEELLVWNVSKRVRWPCRVSYIFFFFVYRCVSRNTMGESSTTLHLIVRSQWGVSVEPDLLVADFGSNAGRAWRTLPWPPGGSWATCTTMCRATGPAAAWHWGNTTMSTCLTKSWSCRVPSWLTVPHTPTWYRWCRCRQKSQRQICGAPLMAPALTWIISMPRWTSRGSGVDQTVLSVKRQLCRTQRRIPTQSNWLKNLTNFYSKETLWNCKKSFFQRLQRLSSAFEVRMQQMQ